MDFGNVWGSFKTALYNKLDEINSSLTAQISSKSSIDIGTYVGDGTAGRNISLNYIPKAVIVFSEYLLSSSDGAYCIGLATTTTSQGLSTPSGSETPYYILDIASATNGFKIQGRLNMNNSTYKYIAIK